MKPAIICVHRLFLLSFTLALSFAAVAQNAPIEIADRRNLPYNVYTALKSYKAILIGEVHGSTETPQFLEGLVKLWLSSGEKVLLGLEINMDEQGSVDSFMRTGSFEIIQEMPFFHSEFKDGRSSIAMAELIRSCYGKNNVRIVCLDATHATATTIKRDSVMARNALRALRENPGWKFISLTGNIHNKTEKSYSFADPMGFWLVNMPEQAIDKKQVNDIDVIYESGTCWNCTGSKITDCDIHVQGNYARSLSGRTIFDNCFFVEEKKLFTRTASASLPLIK